MIDTAGGLVWDLPCVQQASYLERGLLMLMLPLYPHVNQTNDDDDDGGHGSPLKALISKIFISGLMTSFLSYISLIKYQNTQWNSVHLLS